MSSDRSSSGSVKRLLEGFEGIEAELESFLAVNSIDDNRREMEMEAETAMLTPVTEINNESAFPLAQRMDAPKELMSPTPKEQKTRTEQQAAGKKVNGDKNYRGVQQGLCEKFATDIKEKNGERHYTGVRERRPGRFTAEIRDSKGRKCSLGTFDNPKTAALEYDRAASKMRGARARLNFPRTVGSAGNNTCPTVEEPKSNTPPRLISIMEISETSAPEQQPAQNDDGESKPVKSTSAFAYSSSASHHSIHSLITARQRGDKHYRGAWQKRSGKFAASISHPKRKRAKTFHGTFNNDMEAAHAYDLAAYKMGGSKAVLNFPLPVAFAGNNTYPTVEKPKSKITPVKSTPSVSHHSIHPVITAPQATSPYTHTDVLTGGGGRREICFQDLHPEVLGEKEENEESSPAKKGERKKRGYNMYLRCYPEQKEKIVDFVRSLLRRERE